jgi:hypothetical protein
MKLDNIRKYRLPQEAGLDTNRKNNEKSVEKRGKILKALNM